VSPPQKVQTGFNQVPAGCADVVRRQDNELASTGERFMIRTAMLTGFAVLGGLSATFVGATAATAATPTFTTPVAYVRDGAIYTSSGAAEKRLTPVKDSNSRPRWSPDRRRLAYVHSGELWLMNADGSAPSRVVPGRSAGAAFSPDGQWIAYAAAACLGGPGVYRVRATAPHGTPEVLFPAACRGQAAPAPSTTAGPTGGTLAERLRYDDAVAWSPDGTKIAFRGGDCESVYDDCLSIGTIATGAERTLAGFGGGGGTDGYAVVPAWRPDGAKVAWTSYVDGDGVHLVEAGADGAARRRIGAVDDRELAYVTATGAALVTGTYDGRSWVLLLNPATGKRTPFHAGSQPAV
jgi:TolB protein